MKESYIFEVLGHEVIDERIRSPHHYMVLTYIIARSYEGEVGKANGKREGERETNRRRSAEERRRMGTEGGGDTNKKEKMNEKANKKENTNKKEK